MNQNTHTSTPAYSTGLIESLQVMANRLRRHSLVSTSEAGSGHPSTCLSCADLVSALFFHTLRFDVQNPDNPLNDRFVLSKGHGVPVLWAAWAEAGAFPVEKLLTLRRIDSDLEGHPTPRNPWIDVATGSLGQGLSIGLGMALSAKLDGLNNRIFVLTGDGELAEGAVWEAAMLASHYRLDNLVALLDINGLGQSQATMYGSDAGVYERRLRAFGWNTRVVNGHDMKEIVAALDQATSRSGAPFAIVARTKKGKGVSLMEDKDGWHGKAVAKGELLEQALGELGDTRNLPCPLEMRRPEGTLPDPNPSGRMAPPSYATDSKVATRQAYGTALAKLGSVNPKVVVLDGDTKNSTYSQEFLRQHASRFVECFIAEGNMVGAAVGLSALGKIPFASTFACFFSRAFDQVRMGAISQANVKLSGSHCGVSIGEDGPSQMGLEDLAMMRAVAGSSVLYPSDGVSTERLVALAAETPGIVYIRTTRPKTPILYSSDDEFRLGGCKVLRSSPQDRATLVAAGVTLHESLKACRKLADEGLSVRVIDLYSVKPLDEEELRKAARETGAILTVEDHYPEGGLGDAVAAAIAGERCKYKKIAVRGLPRSGPSEALMEAFGLSSRAIVASVKELIG
ncbi:MAG: transketolase [Acidobacteriota bacterium]